MPLKTRGHCEHRLRRQGAPDGISISDFCLQSCLVQNRAPAEQRLGGGRHGEDLQSCHVAGLLRLSCPLLCAPSVGCLLVRLVPWESVIPSLPAAPLKGDTGGPEDSSARGFPALRLAWGESSQYDLSEGCSQ